MLQVQQVFIPGFMRGGVCATLSVAGLQWLPQQTPSSAGPKAARFVERERQGAAAFSTLDPCQLPAPCVDNRTLQEAEPEKNAEESEKEAELVAAPIKTSSDKESSS